MLMSRCYAVPTNSATLREPTRRANSRSIRCLSESSLFAFAGRGFTHWMCRAIEFRQGSSQSLGDFPWSAVTEGTAIPGDARKGRLLTASNHRAAVQRAATCDQWRICFTWGSGDAYDVEIVDYH